LTLGSQNCGHFIIVFKARFLVMIATLTSQRAASKQAIVTELNIYCSIPKESECMINSNFAKLNLAQCLLLGLPAKKGFAHFAKKNQLSRGRYWG